MTQFPLTSIVHLDIYDSSYTFFAKKRFLAGLRDELVAKNQSGGRDGSYNRNQITLSMRTDEPFVELPHLTSLHLCGGQLRCARLMIHLSFPVDISVELICRVTGVSGEPENPASYQWSVKSLAQRPRQNCSPHSQ